MPGCELVRKLQNAVRAFEIEGGSIEICLRGLEGGIDNEAF